MLVGAVLMLVVSIALAWVPFLGPLAGGLVGGYWCGTAKRAALAAILPAILVVVFIYWRISMSEHGIGGIIAAVGFPVLVLLDEIGLWVGVVIGGIIATRRQHQRIESANH